MTEPGVPAIGARIRAERLRRGVSVRGLARDIGVSASLISQIETDKSLPSVSTLYAITTALEVGVEELFATPDQPIRPSSAGAAHAAGHACPRSHGRHRAAPVCGRARRTGARLRRHLGAARPAARPPRGLPPRHLPAGTRRPAAATG